MLTTPTAIEITASVRTMPINSARLSLDPNVRIANAASHSGVASIAAWPTAITGEASGVVTAATRCPTAIATPVTNRPVTAPTAARGRTDGFVCSAVAFIRPFGRRTGGSDSRRGESGQAEGRPTL